MARIRLLDKRVLRYLWRSCAWLGGLFAMALLLSYLAWTFLIVPLFVIKSSNGKEPYAEVFVDFSADRYAFRSSFNELISKLQERQYWARRCEDADIYSPTCMVGITYVHGMTVKQGIQPGWLEVKLYNALDETSDIGMLDDVVAILSTTNKVRVTTNTDSFNGIPHPEIRYFGPTTRQ